MILSNSPVGALGLDSDGDAITRLVWGREGSLQRGSLFREAQAQLNAYFAGELRSFDLPLAPAGGPFQMQFHKALLEIPFGETRTYGQLAGFLGVSAQAIGQACGGNPIPIIIPCHRVVGADGLGGYSGSGGIETKITLLKQEGAASLLL